MGGFMGWDCRTCEIPFAGPQEYEAHQATVHPEMKAVTDHIQKELAAADGVEGRKEVLRRYGIPI